jgi:Zn-dependent membrane protease YugP
VTTVLLALLFVPLILGIGAQRRVGAAFARYRAVANHAGASGGEVARTLLDAHGLRSVRLELVPGMLSDRYDGARQALGLSRDVAAERSVAAIGIAAHEVAHAYQDADGSRAYRLRQAVAVPLMALAPWSGLLFIGGFWLGVRAMVLLSLIYGAGLVVFAIVTVPVELGASRRAMTLLERNGLADQREVQGVRRVLHAAALTYIVGVLQRLGWFLALIFIALAARRVSG